ncbi:uncharacterized protein BDR25DRAFT_363496 [Lindgomyces ingoldianus]|uniref:Uncharacterized protein n=1 Tax=Lindgomyces ingoldianus TaxID=673940 RepID=A0ACB6Q7F5_9PLEO|nr:uncharacterized protein BDR25DRAFT_363496 [Lindgomyces ingoldianus]KAF2462838.1 hypothetical protein BDR25DRAFT_363496 [Lindgomyces ingoldianus]
MLELIAQTLEELKKPAKGKASSSTYTNSPAYYREGILLPFSHMMHVADTVSQPLDQDCSAISKNALRKRLPPRELDYGKTFANGEHHTVCGRCWDKALLIYVFPSAERLVATTGGGSYMVKDRFEKCLVRLGRHRINLRTNLEPVDHFEYLSSTTPELFESPVDKGRKESHLILWRLPHISGIPIRGVPLPADLSQPLTPENPTPGLLSSTNQHGRELASSQHKDHG